MRLPCAAAPAALVALVALFAAGAPARAEVSAELDQAGQYVRMVLTSNSSSRNMRVWGVARPRAAFRALNRDGDLNGDLFPAVGEAGGTPRTPWVVWSRFTNGGYDLAYARWNHQNQAWEPIRWVEPVVSPGDDLAPGVVVDAEGRPFIVWSRDENGVGRVLLSLWLQTRWMDTYTVSDPGTSSVAPAVRLLADGRIEVQYETPQGRVTRIVAFQRPATITDDITPFGRFRIDATLTTPSPL